MPYLNEESLFARKRNIVSSAEKLFSERGFDRVTMQEIAEQVGFTRKTLYSYFSCKEELFVVVHLNGLKKRGQIFAKMQTVENSFEKLKTFTREYKEFYLEYPHYLKLQVYWDTGEVNWDKISSSVKDEFIKQNQEANKNLVDVFKKLQLRGIENKRQCEMLVSSFVLQLRVLLNKVIFDFDPLKKHQDFSNYETFVKIYLAGIYSISRQAPKDCEIA